MEILLNNNTAVLNNPDDDLNATVTYTKGLDPAYRYFKFSFRFASSNQPYFDITAIAHDKKISLAISSIQMYSLAPNTNTDSIDLYKSADDPAQYIHHAHDMMKGFFVSKVYRNSDWHVSKELQDLYNKKQALDRNLVRINRQITDEKSRL